MDLLLVREGNELGKSLFGKVIVSGVDNNNNEEGDHDGGSFEETFWNPMLDDTNDQGYNGGTTENSIDWVLKVFNDQFTYGFNLWWWERIGTVEIGSIKFINGGVFNSSSEISLEPFGNSLHTSELIGHDHLRTENHVLTWYFVMIVKDTDIT